MQIYIDQGVIPSGIDVPKSILLEIRHEIGITVGLFLEALIHHLKGEITGRRHHILCRDLFVPQGRVDYIARSVFYAEMPARQRGDNLYLQRSGKIKAKRKREAPDEFVHQLKRHCGEARGGGGIRLIIGEKVKKMRHLFNCAA